MNCRCYFLLTYKCSLSTTGDVLSGTTSGGEHHYGVLEGWFGIHWWNGRFFVLLVTTLFVFTPLACLKRIGKQLNYQEVITGSRRLMDIWFSTVCFRMCFFSFFSCRLTELYVHSICCFGSCVRYYYCRNCYHQVDRWTDSNAQIVSHCS